MPTSVQQSRSSLLLVLSILLYGLSFMRLPAADPDLGWHLFGGDWILTTGIIPRSDPINAFRLQWHDYHWLGQLGFDLVYRLGGYDALRYGLGVVQAMLFLSLYLFARRINPEPLKAAQIFVLAGAFTLIAEITSIRPQMLALLGLSGALHLFVWPPRAATFIGLFLLSALLANVHVYWVFIPVLWFFFRVLPRYLGTSPQLHPVKAWGGLGLLFLAALISPYGLFAPERTLASLLSNYALLWDYLCMPEVLRQSVFEFRSALSTPGWTQSIILALVALLARLIRRRRFRQSLPELLLLGLVLILSIVSVKYVSLLAIFALPYLIPALATYAEPRLARYGVHLGTMALCLLSSYRLATESPLVLDNFSEARGLLPIDACEALAHAAPTDPPQIRILTHFNYGGWCSWILRQESPSLNFRVTTDNRTQGVPGSHYEASYDLFGLKNNWFHTLQSWAPDYAVLPVNNALAQLLLMNPQSWPVVWREGDWVVLRRGGAGGQEKSGQDVRAP